MSIQLLVIFNNYLPSVLLFLVLIADRPVCRSTMRYANSRLLAPFSLDASGRELLLVVFSSLGRVFLTSSLVLCCRFRSTFGGGMGLDEALGNLVPVKQLLFSCFNVTDFSDGTPIRGRATTGFCCLSSIDCLFNSFIGSRYGSGVSLTIFIGQSPVAIELVLFDDA